MGQNIGTGGRAWGRILGRCEEYTGVLNPRLYFLICSVSSVIDDMEEEILIGWLCTSAVTTLGTTEEVVLEDVEGKETVT